MGKKIITFGNWNGQPIEWIVLKEIGYYTIVISKYHVNQIALSWVGTWESCSFRKYLNNKFWSEAFTQEEKTKVVNTFLPDSNCKDNVFLLSENEASNLMTLDERIYRGNWYLRTPFSGNAMKSINHQTGNFTNNSAEYYIRPAMNVLTNVIYNK
jgi:hypothetical protein